MKMNFAIEKYNDVIGDIVPLFELHWKEIATYQDIPLEPDYGFYAKMSKEERLVCYTARNSEGQLIGYSIFFLRKGHPHYKSHSWASNDIVWLHPDYRGFGVGKRFVAFWDEDLRARGFDVVKVDVKLEHPALGFLLEGCDYRPTERSYEKRL